MPRSSYVWSAPSVASLSHSKIRLDCTPETLRALWRAETKEQCLGALTDHLGDQGKAEDLFHETGMDGQRVLFFGAHKRELLNRVGGFHGVEYLGVHSRSGKVVRYCNAGDSYAPTLCFMGRRLFVACWGDLVDRRVVRPDQ